MINLDYIVIFIKSSDLYKLFIQNVYTGLVKVQGTAYAIQVFYFFNHSLRLRPPVPSRPRLKDI